MSEKELKHIEEIDGKEDNKLFTSENKSLESGPKKIYSKNITKILIIISKILIF